jgi:hypothetical protein
MSRDDLRPDPELRALLRAFDARDAANPADRDALARRILGDAEPILAARRGAQASWWDFTATWARTLIPLGVATAAAAAAFIAWSSHAARRPLLRAVSAQDSLVGAVPRDRTSQDLLDVLVTPSLEPRSGR